MINVVSLTDHRVDVKFAYYISSCLGVRVGLYDSTDFIIVTNGMIANADKEVLKKMKEVKSLYLNDDNVCWIPDKEEYPLCTVLTQFNDRPYDYFQISKLSLFDRKFTDLKQVDKVKGKYIYWGAYRPERIDRYRTLPKGTKVIGKKYPDELADNWEMLPFTKDLNGFHRTLLEYSGYSTIYFGNPEHDGVSISYRLYEALMCGIYVEVYPTTIGYLDPKINWIHSYLKGSLPIKDYKSKLFKERQLIKEELNGFINR